MKKIFLSIFIFFIFSVAYAQQTSVDLATAYSLLEKNKTALALSDKDLSESIIASTYKNKLAGTTMVYLQQSCKGIAIYNQIKSIAFKDGKVVSHTGNFIINANQKINVTTDIPAVNASSAVLAAIADRKLVTKQTPQIIKNDAEANKVTFFDMGVASENITATLMWFVNENGKAYLTLGWQVYIVQNNSADYWLVNIDASTKKTISIHNLTVYCNFNTADDKAKVAHNHTQNCTSSNKNIAPNANNFNNNITPTSNSIVNTANYRVIPYPAESPLHPGGAPVLVTNPWELSGPGNLATTLKWHSIGATNYDITRGNNVWAQEDVNGNNGTSATQVTSTTTPDPLNFDFVPDFTVVPTQTTPIPNQQFNTTNLFYWNNIIHDLTYQYGFDEAARNFQGDNQGRAGIGGDFVLADAQDGSGTNNANFSTPPDGGSGRMQMYLWTAPNPDRDGDVDNGIVVHEYAHGISNRLTGNGSSCLQNAEQMGEGWSDYYCLMYTQNWATSTLNTGFTTPRSIGSYANNQTPTGGGIRSQRYCTDFNINNRVYAASIPGAGGQHSRGEIWCATLWDMTWGIINQVGSINNNIFNANAAGGNSIALKLVTEGMKLQPCSPGFISGRDAILQADQILFGGAYRCTILEAFRRRGMGLGASEGSTASTTDQIPSFINVGVTLSLLQGTATPVNEGQNIVYRNRVTTDACSAISGYTIADTIPLNATYVSGGFYNAANRVVSFAVNQAAGTTVDYTFTININNNTYFAPVTILNETVPAAMPATWTPATTVPATGLLWTVSTAQSSSAPNAFFCENELISTDKRLELTTAVAIPNNISSYPKLSFNHRFNTEGDWDGGVVEVSTNGGTTWVDLGNNFVANPYNGGLGAGAGNNLANRAAFTGLISTFIKSSAKLLPFVGQATKVRFRFGSDDNTAGIGTPTGWFVDDIIIADTASVFITASLFNGASVRVARADTVTQIAQAPASPPAITTQPSSTSVCAGSNATFTATASGGATNTFSWEVSTNAGGSWAPTVPASNTATLLLTNVSVSMSGYQYRLVVNNASGSAISSPATLTVNPSPNAPIVTTPVNYCVNQTATPLTATGTNLLWYATATSTSGSSSAPIISTTTASTTTYFVSQSTTVGGCESPRASITVNVNATPTAPTVTTPITYCQNATATALTATGTNLKWYLVATGGASSTTAPTPNTSVIGNTNFYVSQTSGICEGPRALIAVNVTAITAAPTAISPINYCQGSSAVALTATGSNLLWYNASTGGTGSTTAPIPSTSLVGSTIFYVSQTGQCESARTAVTVNVATTPAAPTVTSPIAYCQGSTAPALNATGTNLLWYANATGGLSGTAAPIPTTTTAGSTTYYVSQTVGSCEGQRAAITVNVSAAPSITSQPQDITSCSTSATFTVSAISTNLTYQWFVSTDAGVNYTALSNANTNTLTLTGLTIAQASNKYRVVISSGACTAATSTAVSARVGILPTVLLATLPALNFNPYTNGILTTTVSPNGNYNYVWKRNNVTISNTNATLTNTTGLIDAFGTYTVTVTDVVTGCVGISNNVVVNDIPGGNSNLYIWPNPTRGNVQISYFNILNPNQKYSITIYDEKGALIINKQLTSVTANNSTAFINLSMLANSTYVFVLIDQNGKQLITKKVIKY